MASWVDDFTSILDSAAGVVGGAAAAASVLKPTTAAVAAAVPAAPAGSVPKQALVANDETKKSTFPWGLVLVAVVVLALVEYS